MTQSPSQKSSWSNFFSKKSATPQERSMYVITRGDKTGCFVVFIHEHHMEGAFAALSMPYPLEALFFSWGDVVDGIKDGTMEFIEVLPQEVYDVCRANFEHVQKKEPITYEYNESNHRWDKHRVSSLLHQSEDSSPSGSGVGDREPK